MGASTGDVDICNLALSLLRQKQITSLAGNTNAEKICKKWYADARRATLESQTWRFAIKRALVSGDTASPAFGWDNQSATLPSDFLRIISLGDDPFNTWDKDQYEIEGNRILTNEAAPYYLRYVADIEDVTQFSSLFKIYFSYVLSLLMARDIGAPVSLRKELKDELVIWERNAYGVNGQSSRVSRKTKSKYLSVRRHGERGDITRLG